MKPRDGMKAQSCLASANRLAGSGHDQLITRMRTLTPVSVLLSNRGPICSNMFRSSLDVDTSEAVVQGLATLVLTQVMGEIQVCEHRLSCSLLGAPTA
jgi:hypothetical protein